MFKYIEKNYKDIDLITLNKNNLGIKSKSIFEFLTVFNK